MPKTTEAKKGGSTTKEATTRRPPKAVVVPEGIAIHTKVEPVPLTELDPSDARFQLRVDRDAIADLVKSLHEEGQQVPIVLWGKQKPCIVIDGHRRSKAAAKLGWPTIKAIIRHDLSEKEAYRLAYLENARRKSLTKLDLAHALWQLVHHQKMTIKAAGESLGMNEDKAGRLLKLLNLPDELQDAVRRGKISMHHALLISKRHVSDLAEVIERIRKEKLSVRKLARALDKPKRTGRKKTYFRAEGDSSFRLSPIRISSNTPEATRREMLEALEKAAEALRKTLPSPG